MLKKIISLVDDKVKKQDFCVVAIDGMAGAGKTTLSKELKKYYGIKANVISIDDFYQPWIVNSLNNGLAPHINKTRILNEILKPIYLKKDIHYTPFNCKEQRYEDDIYLKYKPISIIEGSYSCLPIFEIYYDLELLLITSTIQQKRRLLKREGENNFKNFEEIWLPRESKYFLETDIINRMDLVLKS